MKSAYYALMMGAVIATASVKDVKTTVTVLPTVGPGIYPTAGANPKGPIWGQPILSYQDYSPDESIPFNWYTVDLFWWFRR